MPLLTQKEQFQQGIPRQIEQPEEKAAPPALDVLTAAFHQNNIVTSLYDRVTEGRPDFVRNPEYDVLDDIVGYEDYAQKFLEVESAEEATFIKQRIDFERSNKQLISEAGGWGLAASIGAGVIDPATLASMALPVARGVTTAGTIAKMVATNAAFDTASELAFHALQETRTVEESFINVGAGTIVTGLLGAIASRVPKKEFDALTRAVEKELELPDVGARSMGAAERGADTTLAQEGIAGVGEALAKSIGKINPLARLSTSVFKSSRQLVQELAEIPWTLAKNEQGIATEHAVETLIKRYEAPVAKLFIETDNAFSAYAKRVKSEGGTRIKYREFKEKVAGAMRRGDESDIPEVAAMAKKIRGELIEPLKKELQKAGLLADDLTTRFAESYFPRLYNILKIKNHMTAWEDTLNSYFVSEGIDLLEAKALTGDVTRTILGTTRGMTDLVPNITVKAGPLKERTLAVPDHVIEPFLVSDVEKVLAQHVRTIAPQLELAKRGLFKQEDWEAAIQKISDEHDIFKNAAKSDKMKKDLEKFAKSNVDDLNEIRDRLMGKAGIPADPESKIVRAGRLFRNYNYVRMLGRQVASSMADVGRIMTKYGMVRTARAMAKYATNLKAWKGTREDARRLGVGLDWTLNTRGATLGDIGEYAETTAEEYAQKSANMFSRVTGMATWNSSMKMLASSLQQDAILRAAIKDNASKNTLADFASIGISSRDLSKIAKQYEKHGIDEGLRRARTDLWDDKELALKFEASILKAADIAILTKGAGDTPIFMSSELGKTIFQFKSFGMAAVNRLIIPVAQGMQRGDMKVYNGVMVMLALGYLRYAAKQWDAGREIETDPNTVMAEAIDGAGLTSYFADAYDVSTIATGMPRASRYQGRSQIETAMGPTVGTLQDLAKTTDDLRRDGVSRKDIHKMRKLFPGNNIFGLSQLFNLAETATGDALGLEE